MKSKFVSKSPLTKFPKIPVIHRTAEKTKAYDYWKRSMTIILFRIPMFFRRSKETLNAVLLRILNGKLRGTKLAKKKNYPLRKQPRNFFPLHFLVETHPESEIFPENKKFSYSYFISISACRISDLLPRLAPFFKEYPSIPRASKHREMLDQKIIFHFQISFYAHAKIIRQDFARIPVPKVSFVDREWALKTELSLSLIQNVH